MTPIHPFHGQFVIHNQPNPLNKKWRPRQLGQFVLETHPALSVTPIQTDSGNQVGVFVGYPISPAHEYKPQTACLPPGFVPRATNAESLEDWLYGWRGRYVAIIGPRLYLDAIGSLACVYSPKQQCVASSPWLIPEAKGDEEIVQAYGMPESGKFYPAGLTPIRGVKRLLPNHYLDLETMQAYPHWPSFDFRNHDVTWAKRGNTSQLTYEIGRRLWENISAVTAKREVYLSLTAGRDSRMLLAAAWNEQKRVKFFTYQEQHDTVDLHIARKMAERFGLSWSPLGETEPSLRDKQIWELDVGHCVYGAISRHSNRFAQCDPNRVRLPGLAGEIGRAYYWRPGDREDSKISATDLLRRMKLPINHPATTAHMETWIESVPPWMNTYDLLDACYIENRLGGWAGPSLYGSDRHFAGQIVPLADRYIIERMMALPPEYRRQQWMATEVIRRAWPALIELPFNRYTGVRRWASRHGLRQCVRWAKRVVRMR